jgi:septum site-determining protein MinC
MQNSLTRKPIEIKIATVVAVAVILHQAAIPVLEAALKEMTAGTSDFFDNEFAIVDVDAISGEPLHWNALIALFKSFGLNLVAVRNALEKDHPAIRAQGLNIDTVSKTRTDAKAAAGTGAAEPVTVAIEVERRVAPAIPTMVIDTPVRAGQRIYARGADLIITASVNNGAEVIADGSIHIYAPLRGRALAGASGNIKARIYALSLQAELVSIAGIYRTFENGFPALPAHHPVQIKLIGDSIEVTSMKSVA